VFFWGISMRRTSRRAAALTLEHPHEPWLWRADWAAKTVEPESTSQFLTYVLMGALFILISTPALLNVKREMLARHNYGILVALIFPLAGLYLIGRALLDRARTKRFGAIFRMDQVPGVAGGHLRGRIETRVALPAGEPVDLTLSCVNARRSGRDRWEDIVWQDKASGTVVLGPLGSAVSVDFEIPFDAGETDSRNSNDQTFWRLTATRKLPGIDFKTGFQVPVFKTVASDPAATAENIEAETLARAPVAQPPQSKIRVRPSGDGGLEYYLGAARTRSVALALMAFGLLFGAGGSFFAFAVHGYFGWLAGALPMLIGGGIGILLLMFSVSLLLSTTTLRVSGGELHVKSSLLGIARNKVVRAADIEKFELYPAMRGGNQIWYDLRVHLRGGGKITAGSGLEKREAEWLEKDVCKNLGYRNL